MNVFGCQFDMAWEDKASNFTKVQRLLQGVSLPPGSLLVLPEMFATGFSIDTTRTAEDAGGETVRFLAQLAVQLQCHVIGGIVGRDPAGTCRNQSVAILPDGTALPPYSKIQPFVLGGEAVHHPGSTPVIWQIGSWRVAPFVCYDLRFPELFRVAAWSRPQLYVVIASWPERRIDHWIKLLQARAIENQACVIGVNRVGRDPHLNYTGRSLIVNHRGEIMADAGSGEAVIHADLDLQAVLDYRKELPFLDNMRPDYVRR